FGYSVSIAGDYAIVGAYLDDDGASNAGSAYIFALDQDGDWEQVKKIRASDGDVDDWFGYSVSISGDYAIVGAEYDDDGGIDSGSVYIFYRNEGGTDNWGEVKKITASDPAAYDFFGCSVAISGDGVIVGAWYDHNGGYKGSAYIFARNEGGTDNWGEVTKITASDGAAQDWLGGSVSIYGDYAIVGACGDDDGADGSGSAYIFARNHGGDNNWGELKKITASDAAADDWFGFSVSISGRYAIVGAYLDDGWDTNSGSAYIFARDEGGDDNWGEVTKITASDAAEDDYFGYSVSISGDNAIVGAYRDDDGGTDSGSAYVYVRNEGGTDNWGQASKITASDAAVEDWFGTSVSISSDYAIVGAYGDDDGGSNSGAAFLYTVNAAPVLSDADPYMDAVDEDVLVADNNGTLVSDIVSRSTMTDADDDTLGIAITGVDETDGTWWYRTDDGSAWKSLAGVRAGEATLLAGDAASRVQFRPSPNYNGNVNPGFTFVAWDGSDQLTGGTEDVDTAYSDGGPFSQASDTARITVTADNDVPTTKNGGLQDVNVSEDAPDTVIDLSNYFDDVEDGSSLTYSVEGNWDANLFQNVSINGYQLTLDYKANGNGSDTLTIRGTDNGDGNDGAEHLDQSFSVNVAADNDRPFLIPENVGIPNVTVEEDAPDMVIDLSQYFGDVEEDAKDLDYKIANTPDSSLLSATVGNDGYTLTIDFNDDANGSTNILIEAWDHGDGDDQALLFRPDDLQVTVNPVNDTPTVTGGGLQAVNINEDAPDTVIDLSNYFDDVEDGSSLTYSVEGNWDADLFENVSINGYQLTLDYKANGNGSDTLTIRGTDSGDGNDGAEHLDQTFTVNIASGQDPPTVDLTGLPAMQTPEDTNLGFQGVAVGDVDAAYDASYEMVASLWVDHGTVSVGAAGQATLGGGDGSSQGNALTLTGTPDEINAALAVQGNLTYDPVSQFYGTDTLHVSVDDQGNTGDPAGALTDNETTDIQVGVVKDPTIITVPGRQIVGNYGHLKFGHGNLIRVVDGDAFAESTGQGVTVTVCAKYGNLTLGSTKGIEWVMNNGGRQLTFKALSQSAVNCALYKMDYHPQNYNYTGKIDLIKVKVRDLANQELAIKGVEVKIARAGTYMIGGNLPRRR
ncbi:FG-GAP repeat protein, partial [Thermodesulfobacteriota bacterium]